MGTITGATKTNNTKTPDSNIVPNTGGHVAAGSSTTEPEIKLQVAAGKGGKKKKKKKKKSAEKVTPATNAVDAEKLPVSAAEKWYVSSLPGTSQSNLESR